MFVKEEIDAKKRKVRQLLEDLGLDGILIKRQSNFAWLTGGARNLVGIATEIGVSSALIGREAEYILANNIEAPRLIEEEEIEAQGYEVRSFPWHADGESALARELAGPRLGADVPMAGAVDVAKNLAPLRHAMTPWEVERYKDVGIETARAIEETTAEIRPGDKECTVVGRLAARLWDRGLDYITTFCAADDRIARFRHPLATDRRVEKRAMLCVNARKGGLIVSLTRFVQFGPLPADLRRRYDATVRVDCTLMAHTVPGRPAAEAFRKGIEAYAEAGFPEEFELHHQGGAIGYEGRDYKVTFESPHIVQENQAFTWNPSITGAKSEDTMLATAGGPVILSPPVTFPVLGMEVAGIRFCRPDILEL
ncbi:M24 family metallopeptidase [Shumkonia mesophila]|uniref:M24 family metallopeptidase n=1 Tax=Shumkonia mesophila TaxID=2838854 RepID=UPI0029352517|nr:M24 family metallopeptidase [Shumkonia mesophila]